MQQSLQKKIAKEGEGGEGNGSTLNLLCALLRKHFLENELLKTRTVHKSLSFLWLMLFCENHSNGGKKRSKAHSWPVEAVGSSYMNDTVSMLLQSENRGEKYRTNFESFCSLETIELWIETRRAKNCFRIPCKCVPSFLSFFFFAKEIV